MKLTKSPAPVQEFAPELVPNQESVSEPAPVQDFVFEPALTLEFTAEPAQANELVSEFTNLLQSPVLPKTQLQFMNYLITTTQPERSSLNCLPVLW